MRQKGFAPIIILSLALLGIAGYFAYKYYTAPKGTLLGPYLPSPVVTSIPEEATPTIRPTIDPTSSWKSYTDQTYIFKYPSDWRVTSGTASQKEYWGGDSLTIDSPDLTVSINIAPGAFTYGFGGDVTTFSSELNIKVNNIEFVAQERTRTESGVKKVYVDFIIPKGGVNYHVLFGTGYPVNTDATASYLKYTEYKNTILKILSTLQILGK